MCILTLSSFFRYLKVTWSYIIIYTEFFSFLVHMFFSVVSSVKTLHKWHVKFLRHTWWKLASTAGSLLFHLQKTSMHLHKFAEFQSKNENPEQNFPFLFLQQLEKKKSSYLCNYLETMLFVKQVKNYMINEWKIKVQSPTSSWYFAILSGRSWAFAALKWSPIFCSYGHSQWCFIPLIV